jgi:hypothetical protein
LWLTLDAGTFSSVEIDPKTHAVALHLSPATENSRVARLRIEQPAKVTGVQTFRPRQQFAFERGAFTIPLGKGVTSLTLTDKK